MEEDEAKKAEEGTEEEKKESVPLDQNWPTGTDSNRIP